MLLENNNFDTLWWMIISKQEKNWKCYHHKNVVLEKMKAREK